MTGRRPPRAPQPPHSDAAQAAIRAELVRATLGGPARRELVSPLAIPKEHHR